jgi:L-ribulokinase
MQADPHVLGIDFGTDSVRVLVVNAHSGEEVSSSVAVYPRWKEGRFCDAARQQYRQHPLDYTEAMEYAVTTALHKCPSEVRASVRAIGVDTTGSTPVAVDESGTPLSLLPGFESNPNAMFVLWKDHTAVKEAAEINIHAVGFPADYLKYVGGIYSSEWFWAKLLHILRSDEKVRGACHSFVEHCDWIPFLLTGGTNLSAMKRGVCSAGHKALWAEEFGGLPPDEFFSSLDPMLAGFRKRLFEQTCTADQSAGTLCKEWSSRLGLDTSVIVAVGAFDAHIGAVGGQIEPYHLSKVMGTSTCDMLVAPLQEMKGKLVRGICGQVDGSIIPGMIGLEAGQSAFGDSYAWFRDLLLWPVRYISKDSDAEKSLHHAILRELSDAAEHLPLDDNSELAVDWLNGRRTPDASQEVKAALMNLNLASDAPRVFRAVAESTCFGARAIVERFTNEGIPVKGVIGLGGVARKSPYIMQMMADVLGMPIRIHKSDQTCALGAAMFAATAAGIYPKVEEAMRAIGPGFDAVYRPDAERSALYSRRYHSYKRLASFTDPTFTA